jgi:hypothetical protein
MDNREARGRALAQSGRVKPVEGGLWFVPSDTAGGWIVDGDAGRCNCPDAQRGVRCKHLIAVAAVREAPKPETPAKVLPRGDLTIEEQARGRAALKFARTRAGGWDAVAKGTRLSRKTLEHVAYGRTVTATVVVRLARFVGVPVDSIIDGTWPPPGVCLHCGQSPP